MDVLLQLVQNTTMVILIGITLYFTRRHQERLAVLGRLYFVSGLVLVLMLWLEPLTVFPYQGSAMGVQVLMGIANVMLVVSPTVLAACWYLSTKEIVTFRRMSPGKGKELFFVPFGLVAVLAVLSPFHGLLFHMGGSGVVQNGLLWPLLIVIPSTYLMASFFYLMPRRESLHVEQLLVLLVVPMLPAVGGCIQLFTGKMLGWCSVACALIVFYFYLHDQLIRTDSLTSAWTKGTFEHHLSKYLQQTEGEIFGMIYLDVDNLKFINDRYGHAAGDLALKVLVDVIKGAIRKTDAVARLGGDEFGILIHVDNQKALDSVVRKIERVLDIYNKNSDIPYRVSCSMGAKLFQADPNSSVEFVIAQVDSLMYANKVKKRAKSMKMAMK